MKTANVCFVVVVCLVSILSVRAPAQPITFTIPWSQLAELTPTNQINQDWFGVSVALSGTTAVVGAFDPNIETTGAAYVFVKPATGWGNMTQTAVLTPSDGGAGFGTSVAISGDTIIVGAANASNFDSNTPQQQGPGAAYVFVKPQSGWTNMTETAKLTASDGMDGDALGYNVSISGNTAAVGALFAHRGAGGAYVFVEGANGWGNTTQTAELTASDSSTFDNMGSVAIRGNTVVTGAYGHNNFRGAAYVFVEPRGGWRDMTQTAEFGSPKPNILYGFSVAMGNELGVVGAVGAHLGVGAAFLYARPQGGWQNTSTFTAKLSAPINSGVSGLSQGISISGKTISLGGPGTTVGSNSGQGAVLVYIKPETGWATTNKFVAELTASDGAANDNLGVSAAVSGRHVVGGATKSGPPGEAYVFGINGYARNTR